ncbi:hypothetical protein AGRO_4990 [Agrobacterium sp. ATCC 31749]|nr:hypothetical protein AGRO_4990 [Agrobacterium sp. ATCC 31749]
MAGKRQFEPAAEALLLSHANSATAQGQRPNPINYTSKPKG